MDQKHPGGLCSREHISQAQARIPANLEPCKSRQRKPSDRTKNVKIRHRQLGQMHARTGTRFKKKRARSKMHFSSRTAAFARRVFLTRNKLIREPGCVGKLTNPATTWNSRFAESIPSLTGIFTGKTHENSSGTPTSGSHNSLVRTPIRANFVRWKEDVESFPTICCMTHFEQQKTSKTALEIGSKKGTRAKIEEDQVGGWRGRIRLPRGRCTRGVPSSRFFSPFIHDLCCPSPFIILLLLYLYALSYLLLLFVDLSIFIALFTFLRTCEYIL